MSKTGELIPNPIPITPDEQRLIKFITKYGPMTRGELWKISGVPRSTLYDRLTNLELKGLLEKKPEKLPIFERTPGRPAILFSLKGDTD